MRFTILLLAACVAAACAIAPLQRKDEKIKDKYLVMINHNLDISAFRDRLAAAFTRRQFKLAKILKVFKAVKTISLELSEEAVDFLRSFDGVIHVEEDGMVYASNVASWGIDRIDQTDLPLDDTYNTPQTSVFANNGAGVSVYVIDTGINPTHQDFKQSSGIWSRAAIAYDAMGGDGSDCNGHGTHCAGTVAGLTYGVADGVDVYGVRVLGCFGSGSTSGVIDGMNWVAENGRRPGIASMSLGGGASTLMDNAVNTLKSNGFTVVVAAGNEYADACNTSPARATNALTVGATDSTDAFASFSNWGSCVDIQAPGVSITSSWHSSNSASRTISGTSMACPHVAGVAALALSIDPTLDVDAVVYAINNHANSKVSGTPTWSTTKNLLCTVLRV